MKIGDRVGLTFEHVSFRYRSTFRGQPATAVVEDFSWSLPPGKTVLLGPNGAGKTTLLSLAATSLRPAAGEIRLDGLSSTRERRALRRSIATMPQGVHPIPGFTAREQVAYVGWLRGLDTASAPAAALVALERVGLGAMADTMVSCLSGGQVRRVGLAQALVRPAQVLLLDEPTAGLDPAQRARFRELLAELPVDVPVLVSTHQVDDLTELFDTVVVLDRGVVCYQGSPGDFQQLAPDDSARPAEAAYLALLGIEP